MTRHLIITTPLAILLIASGCVGQMGEEGTHVNSVQGSLGEVSFQGEPEIREVQLSRNELMVDLRIQDLAGNWAMVQLTIPRGDRDDDVGSTSLALRPDDSGMVGCSGPDDGDWEFDCNPDELDVTVTESPDGDFVRVDFEGDFTNESCGDIPYHAPPEGQPVDGSVDVDLI